MVIRSARANNPAIGSRHNPEEPLVHLMYLDVINLYGKAMWDPYSARGFRWLTEKEVEALDFQQLQTDDCRGYIFEVDLEIPHELYDHHSDYPLALKRLEIDESRSLHSKKGTFQRRKSRQQEMATNLRNKTNT